MTLKLGDFFIVCVAIVAGFFVGNTVAGVLGGLALMPLAGVLAYKYARESPE